MGFDAWRTGLAVLALLGVAQGACAGMRGILSRMRTGGKGWLGFYALEFIFGWCCFGAMDRSFCRGVFSLDKSFFLHVSTLQRWPRLVSDSRRSWCWCWCSSGRRLTQPPCATLTR